jgi:hypothetical protein
MTGVAWLSLILHAAFLLVCLTSFRSNRDRFRLAAALHLIVAGVVGVVFSLAATNSGFLAPDTSFLFIGGWLLSLRNGQSRFLSAVGIGGAASLVASLAIGLSGELIPVWNTPVLLQLFDPHFVQPYSAMAVSAQILALSCASVSAWKPVETVNEESEGPTEKPDAISPRRTRVWILLTMLALYASRESGGLRCDFFTTHSVESSSSIGSGLADWSPVTTIIGGPFPSGKPDLDEDLLQEGDRLWMRSHFALCTEYKVSGFSWTPLIKKYQVEYTVGIRQFQNDLHSGDFKYGYLSVSGSSDTFLFGFCTQRKLEESLRRKILRRVNRTIHQAEERDRRARAAAAAANAERARKD